MTAGGAGSTLFVINLCASIAPVQTSAKNLPGLDNYRLYQVARVEDGRTRHRLRLGFFTSQSHAERVLTVVRQQYPTAFTACLSDEDRKFARGFLPDTAHWCANAGPKRPVVAVGTPAPAASTTNSKTASPKVTKTESSPAQPVAAKPAASKTLSRAEPEVIELTWEPNPTDKPPADKPAAAAANDATAGLDEFVWEPPTSESGRSASTSDTAKQPILVPRTKKPAIKAASATTPKTSPAPVAAAVVAPVVAPVVGKTAPKTDTATSMRVQALKLSLAEPAPPAPESRRSTPAPAFHVGKGVEIADAGIRLQSDPPAVRKPTAPAAKAVPAAKPTLPAPRPAAATKQPIAKAPVTPFVVAPVKPAAPSTRPLSQPLPDLDSTQTIRALTSAELSEDTQEKSFAIQLAVSEQPVNLDTMPHLDIFEAYRLYSVATAGGGKIIHSLRLGFFKEAVSAEAVSGYLKTFFGSPTVLRVSMAEQARFKDGPQKKSMASGESKPEGKVVELNNARAARPVIPTVMEVVPAPKIEPAASGSFKIDATL